MLRSALAASMRLVTRRSPVAAAASLSVAALLLPLALPMPAADAAAGHAAGAETNLVAGATADSVGTTRISRISGAGPYETAAVVAARAYPNGVRRAILASADTFTDGLVGSTLAGKLHAPVLFTREQTLPTATAGALDRLGVQEVVVLGAELAVSGHVVDRLRMHGYAVRRIGGGDRFATAARIARDVGTPGTVRGVRTAILIRGDRMGVAAVVGPLAARRRLPVLLTPPGRLSRDARAAMDQLGIRQVILAGPPSVVGENVADQLRAVGVAVIRISGRTRTDVAARFAGWTYRNRLLPATTALLTHGSDFPAVVAAAPYGGSLGAPVLFAQTRTVPGYPLRRWLVHRGGAVRTVMAVGSREAVSDRVLHRVAAAATTPQRTYTYDVRRLGAVHSDLARFADHVERTLTDPRGWSLGHDLRFSPVRSGGDFTVNLASPAEVAAASSGCSATWSCRVGRNVYINDDRWRLATESYAHRSLDSYRHYVVNHEVGHWLGLGHTYCGVRGRPATVMQQQSKGLQGCRSRVWPLAEELRAVRSSAL